MKKDFLFAGLNLNIIIQRNRARKNANFTDDASKTRDIKYLNVETLLLFATPCQNFSLRACIDVFKFGLCRANDEIELKNSNITRLHKVEGFESTCKNFK